MVEFEAGVFLIDKPEGPSSFTMVRNVRRLLGMKKVGHAGTLDPFASGLLIICAGRPATKLISQLMEGDKEYIATLQLGCETTTHDPEGEIVARQEVAELHEETVERCLSEFLGEQLQTPPAFSALKHKGKPLYYYARKGIEVKKNPRRIVIQEIEWLDRQECIKGDGTTITIRVTCSKGTYIRTLAYDIGRQLGCGAYVKGLRRTRSGTFSVENSFPGTEFTVDNAYEKFTDGALSVETVRNLLQ